MRVRCALCFCLSLLLLDIGPSRAGVIGLAAFGPTTTIEDFEGIAPIGDGTYPNMPISTPFTFPSGILMDQPVPSITGTFGPYVVELLGGGGFFGMGSTSGHLVPSGTAYLAQANPGLLTDDIRFVLPAPSRRIGAYFATATDSSSGAVTFEAYDRFGQMVASKTLTNVHFANWKNTFVGLESEEISYAMFRGNHASVLRVDDFMFEVPEPAAGLAAFTLALTLMRRHRVHRRDD